MAMVKIQKDGKVIKVPMGAYNSNYKKAGWNLVGKVGGQVNAETAGLSTQNEEFEESQEEELDETVEELDETVEEQEEKDEWDEADEELEQEKDIDSMDMNELKAKAKALGIATKNLSTVGDYRKAIKKALSKQ